MALTVPEGFSSPVDHFSTDPRVMWALDNGMTPDPNDFPVGFIQKETSAPGFDQFIANVLAWEADGFICNDVGDAGSDFLIFHTAATNLGVTPPANVVGFLTRTEIERASKTDGLAPLGGKQLELPSTSASITGDDRYVAFVTEAAIPMDVDGDGDLDQVDENGVADVYVRDLFLGTTCLVTHAHGLVDAPNGPSSRPHAAVNADGVLRITFESLATDLVQGFEDANGPLEPDVYVADFAGFNGTSPATVDITLVSRSAGAPTRGGNGPSRRPTVAGTPTLRVAFHSLADDLFADFADANGAGTPDVFLRDGADVVLVSASTAGANQGGARASTNASISANGGFVAFQSRSEDLFAGFTDANGAGTPDVFLRDLDAGTTALASASVFGPDLGGNGGSTNPSVSADGGFVAFESEAGDLVMNFTDGNAAAPDVYLRDVGGGTTSLISAAEGATADGGDGGSFNPTVALDGGRVAFDSLATDLVAVDNNGFADVFAREQGGTTTDRLSRNPGAGEPDGPSTNACFGSGTVVFESLASGLVGIGVDTNGVSDVFRADP